MSCTTKNAKEEEEPTYDDLIQMRQKYFSNSLSVSYSNRKPLWIERGSGVYLFSREKTKSSSSGRNENETVRYLDTRNNVAHVGHCHPKVIEAVTNQMILLNTNTRYLHPNVCLLAERVLKKCPPTLSKIFFVNSGSEANDLALRLAYFYTKSRNIVCVESGYHGHTNECINVSPYKFLAGVNPLGPCEHVKMVPAPDTFRGKYLNDDVKCVAKYVDHVKEAVEGFKENGGVAGFIVEGGMSVAGVIIPPTGYMKDAVNIVRESGGLYIADEVQTGFGRLGNSFWAFEQNEGVCPDILTLGKPFGNGMPLAAVITSEKVTNAFDKNGVEYFNTFGGNPVVCAAGLAMMDILEEENLQENALRVGNYMKERFLQLKNETELIGDIRGSGLFIGVELIRRNANKIYEPASEETSFICTVLKETYHILTSIDGPGDNVVVIKPPMCFNRDNVDEFIDAFRKVVINDLPLFILKGPQSRTFSKTPT